MSANQPTPILIHVACTREWCGWSSSQSDVFGPSAHNTRSIHRAHGSSRVAIPLRSSTSSAIRAIKSKLLRNRSSARRPQRETEAGEKRMRFGLLNRVLMLGLITSLSLAGAQTPPTSPLQSPPPFRPGELWPDASGTPINAHGGGFLFRNGTYYWFGEFKTAGPGGNAANVGVSVYSSRDLYHWKNEGIALKVSDDPASDILKGCVIERPKVLFNAKTGLYVMWFHLELKGKGYNAARAGVATSKSPTGPFTFLRDFRPDGEMSRDMTLYQDDDGKAYLITTSENNQTQHVSQLTDDFLDTTGDYTRILAHKALEGEAIFKANGHYFSIGSHSP